MHAQKNDRGVTHVLSMQGRKKVDATPAALHQEPQTESVPVLNQVLVFFYLNYTTAYLGIYVPQIECLLF